MEVQSWSVPPDNTVQVVDPMGAKGSGDSDDGDDDELPARKNWLSIIISLTIITFVLLMVLIATLLMGPQAPSFYGRRLKMDDLFNSDFKPKPMGVQWMDSDKLSYRSEGAGIRLLYPKLGINSSLVTELAITQTGAVEFSVSPDLKYVLLCHDIIKGQLFTRTALYSVYDVSTNHYYPLTFQGGLLSDSGMPERLQQAKWAGDSFDSSLIKPRKGHSAKKSGTGSSLILIKDGSVYYMKDPSNAAINLTPDANSETLSYGAPDLIYQEILREETALWPSPYGKSLLVASFNNSEVRKLPVLQYGGGYPTTQYLRYPTVETPLPEVTLWLYDLTSTLRPFPRSKIQPPSSLKGKPHYVISGGWADEDRVWVTWVGGNQSISALTLCSKPYWFCSNVLMNQMQDEVSPIVRGVKWAGKWAAFPWSAKDTEGSWHSHVALVGEAGGRRPPITSPSYHVEEVLGTDIDSKLVYFKGLETSAMKNGEYNEQIFSTSADGQNTVQCITCNIKNKNIKFVDEHDSFWTNEDSYDIQNDRWCHTIRDGFDWREQTKPYKDNEVDCNATLTEIHDTMNINKQSIYQQCSSVQAKLSLSSKYLAVTCFNDGGVPPSLWLVDLQRVKSKDKTGEAESQFGNQEISQDGKATSDTGNYLPLLLHSQTESRLRMGAIAMPSIKMIGMKLGINNMNQNLHERRTDRNDVVYSRVILTIPPGWSEHDHTWLFPLLVEIIGPDEHSESGISEEEMGFQWSDYLASGHQVAHARISLWGADPSVHTSAQQLARFHTQAVRQLLENYSFLDSNNVAIYGRGIGATIAMEAAAFTPPLFQCVTLISPINDWHAHGVYWSERILGTATEDGAEQRYVESNIARLAIKFKNTTPILLIHSTSDQYSHHGFSLAHALTEQDVHFDHIVYPNDQQKPGFRRLSRHLLAEAEYFLFSWVHDPLIYEDHNGNMVEDTTDINMRKYETRFDIRRSFGKLKQDHS